MIFSPLSLSGVVAMVKLGGLGETSGEIEKRSHFPHDDSLLRLGYWRILKTLNGLGKIQGKSVPRSSPFHSDSKLLGREPTSHQRVNYWSDDELKLVVVNKIYVQNGLVLNKDFVHMTSTYFGTPVEQVNFDKATKAASSINRWVEEKTRNKIKNIVSTG